MNNAVFGKNMEKVRNRVNLNLITDFPNQEEGETENGMSSERKRKRRLSHPKVQNVTIFNEHMACVQTCKAMVKMNKPIYCGPSILDLSKTLMYDFHYKTMMTKYGPENASCYLPILIHYATMSNPMV
jgi:hypothetical protein